MNIGKMLATMCEDMPRRARQNIAREISEEIDRRDAARDAERPTLDQVRQAVANVVTKGQREPFEDDLLDEIKSLMRGGE